MTANGQNLDTIMKAGREITAALELSAEAVAVLAVSPGSSQPFLYRSFERSEDVVEVIHGLREQTFSPGVDLECLGVLTQIRDDNTYYAFNAAGRYLGQYSNASRVN